MLTITIILNVVSKSFLLYSKFIMYASMFFSGLALVGTYKLMPLT